MSLKRIQPPRNGEGHGVAFLSPVLEPRHRIEAALQAIHHTLDAQFKRMAAMQAEIDLLEGKQRSS